MFKIDAFIVHLLHLARFSLGFPLLFRFLLGFLGHRDVVFNILARKNAVVFISVLADQALWVLNNNDRLLIRVRDQLLLLDGIQLTWWS